MAIAAYHFLLVAVIIILLIIIITFALAELRHAKSDYTYLKLFVSANYESWTGPTAAL